MAGTFGTVHTGWQVRLVHAEDLLTGSGVWYTLSDRCVCYTLTGSDVWYTLTGSGRLVHTGWKVRLLHADLQVSLVLTGMADAIGTR
jgi:hypothetical protein